MVARQGAQDGEGLPEQLKSLVDQLVAEHELKLRNLATENECIRRDLAAENESLHRTLAAENEWLRRKVLDLSQRPQESAGPHREPPPAESEPCTPLGEAPKLCCGFSSDLASETPSSVDLGMEQRPVALPGAPSSISDDEDSIVSSIDPRWSPLEKVGCTDRHPSTAQVRPESTSPTSDDETENASPKSSWWSLRPTSRRSTRNFSFRNPFTLSKKVESDLITLRQTSFNEEDRQLRLATAYQDAKDAQRAGVRGLMLRRRMSVLPSGQMSRSRQRVLDFISWWLFDAMIGFVIMANSVTIGVETTWAVQGLPVPLSVKVLENVFLGVYILELALRFYGVGRSVLRSNWVKFDCFLVFCGILDLIYKASYQGISVGVLDQVMLIRMLRLCRLIRAVRLVVQFRTLYLLVQGLLMSMVPMMWVFLICISVTYVFAVIGMEMINVGGEYGEDYLAITQANFKSIGDAMMMLLQFIMMDSVGGIYRPLIKVRPELAAFFIAFILLGSISLMNLVTAITVESSLRQAKEDQDAQKAWEDMKRKELAPMVRSLFETLDANGDGELELQEIKTAPPVTKDQLFRICNMDDLEEIFHMLDYDNSGGVDIEEFCNGVMRAQADKPMELLRIVKQCSEILKQCRALATAVGAPIVRQTSGAHLPKAPSSPLARP